MENKTIVISEKDGELFDYIKHCKDEAQIKKCLLTAIELYNYCTGGYQLCAGYPSPTSKKNSIKDFSKEQLEELKKEYQKEITEWINTFDPYRVDLGIMMGPDEDKYWFVEESGSLGFIVLYNEYIKVIDELLMEKK